MKPVIFFLLLTLPLLSVAQRGFRLIDKAANKIEQGKLKKALEILEKAEHSNYGFCGLTYTDAYQNIALLRFIIYDSLQEPLKAANTLNKLYYFQGMDLDSLKMTYYLDVYDKEKLKQQMDTAIEALTPDSTNFREYFYDITLNVTFADNGFSISYENIRSLIKRALVIQEKNQHLSFLEAYKLAIREEAFYTLLE
ncbi:hypothetical protein SAMN05216474_0048 [Lishizhenia tianjinensis]|uniref:Uncharacterized protein n=1 Tax=Lishizhenia tianjinensis TaxID=477690 RepID=A0A1I6XA99_9FLAO|nr:hypothetical protein [Lishizhenia tianjinensis]SFT35199.1 hypothetical protein SAMN05216474_0048 [Lishizhenia tianjinensis]